MTGEPAGRRNGLPGVNSAEALFAVDANQRIIAWNGEAARVFGYPAATAIGWRCYRLVAGRDQEGRPFCRPGCDVVRAAATGAPPATMYLNTRTRDGARLAVDVSTIAVAANGSTGAIIHLCRDPGAVQETEPAAGAPELTSREQEVLRALCSGASTAAIADEMGVSTTTVRNHVQRLLAKLPAHSRAEAVALAYRTGLVTIL
jgi:PAS domain S-box-containing protein